MAEAWNIDQELSVYHLVAVLCCNSLEVVLGTGSLHTGSLHTVGDGVGRIVDVEGEVGAGHTVEGEVEVGHTVGVGVGHTD